MEGGGGGGTRWSTSVRAAYHPGHIWPYSTCQATRLAFAYLHAAEADGAGVTCQLLLSGLWEAVVQAVLQAAVAQVAAQAAPQACHHETDIKEQQAVNQAGLQAVQPPAAGQEGREGGSDEEGKGVKALTQCMQSSSSGDNGVDTHSNRNS